MLAELLYTSAATSDMTSEALIDLLETSRRNNARNQITGMLVYHERSFLQLLEGEEEAIMRLYQTILEDPRHTQSRILWKGPIAERSYGEWTMAFKNLGDVDPTQLEGYSRFLEEGFASDFALEHPSVAQSLMRSLGDLI